MLMRPLLLLCFLFLQCHLSFAETLQSAIEEEKQKLVLCPTMPTVAVEGDSAEIVKDKLLHFPAFRNTYLIVDRSWASNESDTLCSNRPKSESQTVLIPQLFAMYYLKIVYAKEAQASNLFQIQLARTDTGKVIFQRSMVLNDKEPSAFETIITTLLPDLTTALSENAYACRNKFTAVVTEDIKLRCQGQVPGQKSQYAVTSDLHIIFDIKSFDFSGKASELNIAGSVRVLPSEVKTQLRLAVSSQNKECKRIITSTRSMLIRLEERVTPAIFHLTVPNDLSGTWNLQPKITSAEPLFIGNAEMNNVMKSMSEGSCKAPIDEQSTLTYFQHREHNVFKFSEQELKPLCKAVNFVQPVFSKAPSLGTPEASDITTGCTASTANVQVTLKRRFYDYS